jgi:predicted MFS family arabinose efflux permease
VRETRVLPDGDDSEPSGLQTVWSYVRSPGAARILLLLTLYKFGDAFASGMLRPLLVDQGHSMANIGTIVGGVGFVAGLLGAVTGGIIGDRTTRKRALLVGVVLQAVGGAFYIPLSLEAPGYLTAAAIVGVEHFTGGIATVILFTCMMDWCRPRHTGADYTVLASTVVIATGAASALSGISAELLGYAGHFAVAVSLAVVGGAAAVRIHATLDDAARSN